MILVDTQIHEKIQTCNLIENADANQIKSILYDLRSDSFISSTDSENHGPCTHVTLLPSESIMVATQEIIKLPNNMIGHVVGRNSRIRQGLFVESPVYQPGHHTRIYFRLTNLSNSSIELSSDKSYASIIFEELSNAPQHPYSGTFSNEYDYSNLGDYTSEYKRELNTVEKKVDEIKHFESKIYGNVITILTIFIAIFSIISVNVDLAGSNSNQLFNLIIFNLCTIGSISLLADLVMYFLANKAFKHWLWVIPIICFVGAFITLFIH